MTPSNPDSDRRSPGSMSDAAGDGTAKQKVKDDARDAKRLARDNPALFMLGSIGVGFGLSRCFKASAERDHQDSDSVYQSDDAMMDDDVFR